MTPEEKARLAIDEKLNQSGWVIQDMKRLNLSASLGVAVREFPTSTGEVDYALFVDGKPAGVVEAKREEAGEHMDNVIKRERAHKKVVAKCFRCRLKGRIDHPQQGGKYKEAYQQQG